MISLKLSPNDIFHMEFWIVNEIQSISNAGNLKRKT